MMRARFCLSLGLGAAVLSLAGCTIAESTSAYFRDEPWEPDPRDPLEIENRAIYAFNDTVDRAALKPAAEAYKEYTPEPVQGCVRNFFSNLKEPVRAASHALTLNGQGVADSTTRFFFNTVVGWLGCADVAGEGMNIKRNDNDLGLATRAIFGGDETLFIMLPLLGPSSPEDLSGAYVGNFYLDPLDATLPKNDGGSGHGTHLDKYNPYSTPRNGLRNIYLGVEGLGTRADLLEVTDLVDTAALDPYAFVRDGYLERRAALAEEIRER